MEQNHKLNVKKKKLQSGANMSAHDGTIESLRSFQ